MTIYTNHNARGSTVFDVNTKEQLQQVMLVDTEAGEVECAFKPIRVNHLGEVDTFKVKFRTISPIFGGGIQPCLFHCYGRLA